MSQLFNNKYYNQLFGGKKEEQQQKKRQQREQDEESMSTEDTRQRLERIFGGVKGKKGTAKPKAGRKSDAEILAEGKVMSAGKKDGKQLFEFKNGALAVRDASGRFVIVKGAPADTLDALRARRTGPKAQRISTNQAKKAFSSYWNRKMREAASHDQKHGLKGRKSHTAAVKRSKSYHMKYAHKNPARHLSPESDKGYLYLRKERILRDASGMPSRNKKGSIRVRRAGPAIYDFIGVAPEVLQMSKRTGSKAAIMHARKSLSKKSAKRASARKSASSRKAAMMAARMELYPSPAKPAKRVAKAKSARKSASKKVRKTRSNAGKARGPRKVKSARKSASASKKVRKTRSNAGKARGPRKVKSAAKGQHIRFTSTSSRKSASAPKKVRKTRSNAGKARGPRKGKATATVEEM
jgi:hypothetical protein